MILDIILIVLFVGIMLYGYKKGAIGIIAKLVTVILSFIIAYLLADTVGEYISKTSFGLSLQTSITNTITEKLNTSDDSELVVKIQETIGTSTENQIIIKIIKYMFTGFGFAAVFIVTRIILWIGQKVLESIFELPVLKAFNKLGGIITAAILFILELSIGLGIIKVISTLSFMNSVVSFINSSIIIKAIYDHNIITNLILVKIIK